MKLLEGRENRIEACQLFSRRDPCAGRDPSGNEGLDVFYDCRFILNEKVELGRFLERKNVHIARSREHQFLIKEEQLGVDHGVCQVYLDGCSHVEVVNSPVVHIIADVGLSGKQDRNTDSPGSGFNERIREFRVSNVGDLNVDCLLYTSDAADE